MLSHPLPAGVESGPLGLGGFLAGLGQGNFPPFDSRFHSLFFKYEMLGGYDVFFSEKRLFGIDTTGEAVDNLLVEQPQQLGLIATLRG